MPAAAYIRMPLRHTIVATAPKTAIHKIVSATNPEKLPASCPMKILTGIDVRSGKGVNSIALRRALGKSSRGINAPGS